MTKIILVSIIGTILGLVIAFPFGLILGDFLYWLWKKFGGRVK